MTDDHSTHFGELVIGHRSSAMLEEDACRAIVAIAPSSHNVKTGSIG